MLETWGSCNQRLSPDAGASVHVMAPFPSPRSSNTCPGAEPPAADRAAASPPTEGEATALLPQ